MTISEYVHTLCNGNGRKINASAGDFIASFMHFQEFIAIEMHLKNNQYNLLSSARPKHSSRIMANTGVAKRLNINHNMALRLRCFAMTATRTKIPMHAPKIKRFIEVDKDFCQCLGLVISEGDKSNITMNISEREYLEDFLRKYEKITGLKFNNKCFYEKEDKNSIEFAVPCKNHL